MRHAMTKDLIEQFKELLVLEEKAGTTVEKYVRDVYAFWRHMKEPEFIDKKMTLAYKEWIAEHYAPASVNAMLTSLNSFFKKYGWHDCTVKLLRVQKDCFRAQRQELTKAEYLRLLEAAKERNDMRMYLLMETICSTGIRVGELKFITTEALDCGFAVVSLKGKTRTVLLPRTLKKKLRKYTKERGIKNGSIFVTRTGKPMDRSNICHAMKSLCGKAGVSKEKVFPHNLRHLFACTFYRMKKDLSRLADVLGHSNINTTRRYTLVSGKTQEKLIDTLGLVT